MRARADRRRGLARAGAAPRTGAASALGGASSAAAAAAAAAAAVFLTIGSPDGGPGIENAAAAVKKAADRHCGLR